MMELFCASRYWLFGFQMSQGKKWRYINPTWRAMSRVWKIFMLFLDSAGKGKFVSSNTQSHISTAEQKIRLHTDAGRGLEAILLAGLKTSWFEDNMVWGQHVTRISWTATKDGPQWPRTQKHVHCLDDHWRAGNPSSTLQRAATLEVPTKKHCTREDTERLDFESFEFHKLFAFLFSRLTDPPRSYTVSAGSLGPKLLLKALAASTFGLFTNHSTVAPSQGACPAIWQHCFPSRQKLQLAIQPHKGWLLHLRLINASCPARSNSWYFWQANCNQNISCSTEKAKIHLGSFLLIICSSKNTSMISDTVQWDLNRKANSKLDMTWNLFFKHC